MAPDAEVVVIGGGVVGCAVAHALARRGVAALIVEAEPGLGLAASGTNSGILHTGFDSKAGELETRLILRSAVLREQLAGELGITSRRCGARMMPADEAQRRAVRALARNARGNGVEARLEQDGTLTIPGEAITDPVAFVHALAGAALAAGASVRLGARVSSLARGARHAVAIELADGERLEAQAAVNCAGLYADEVARMAGEGELVSVYPRKGEFLVFAPAAGASLEQILLPVPSALGKGMLVFPTLDGHVIAGPSAREREDKRDWSVEPDAREQILPRAIGLYPPLQATEQVGAYAGLRPAGRGANYVIEASRVLPGLVHAAAIRSTGLSASLGIGEHVVDIIAAQTAVAIGPIRELPAPADAAALGGPATAGAWWERAARHHGAWA